MKKLNDYVSDSKIYNLVEDNNTYGEVAEIIEDETGEEFSTSTIGNHYRDYKETLSDIVIEVEEDDEIFETDEDFEDVSAGDTYTVDEFEEKFGVDLKSAYDLEGNEEVEFLTDKNFNDYMEMNKRVIEEEDTNNNIYGMYEEKSFVDRVKEFFSFLWSLFK